MRYTAFLRSMPPEKRDRILRRQALSIRIMGVGAALIVIVSGCAALITALRVSVHMIWDVLAANPKPGRSSLYFICAMMFAMGVPAALYGWSLLRRAWGDTAVHTGDALVVAGAAAQKQGSLEGLPPAKRDRLLRPQSLPIRVMGVGVALIVIASGVAALILGVIVVGEIAGELVNAKPVPGKLYAIAAMLLVIGGPTIRYGWLLLRLAQLVPRRKAGNI